MQDAPHTPAIPAPLFVLCLLYGGMTVIAGVLGFKQVALGPLAVEAGIFAFLMLVVLSSTVAQLYGAATANSMVRWGFVPGWVKDPREFPLLINARVETMAEKPAFRDALKHGRCIIPASAIGRSSLNVM